MDKNVPIVRLRRLRLFLNVLSKLSKKLIKILEQSILPQLGLFAGMVRMRKGVYKSI